MIFRWKTLDAALEQNSVSVFNVKNPETAVSRWARARTKAAKVCYLSYTFCLCLFLLLIGDSFEY